MDDIDSDDHDQEDIIIPIKDKTWDLSPSGLGYRTENGVTVIKIDKSNNGNVECEICSSTLKSLNNLERHMKAMHSHTCFWFGLPFGSPNPTSDFVTDEKNRMC